MYCSHCGVENKKDSKYCFNCGSLLNNKINNNTGNKNTGNKETSLILGIICLVSSFFLNIICFIPGIISIVYANKYKKESGKLGTGFGLSLGGMIYSLVVLIIFIILFFLFISIVKESINNDYNYNINTEFSNILPRI